MTAVLTTGSRVACSSQGTVQTSSNAKLSVNGRPVLLKAGIASKSIAGCSHPVDSSKGIAACTTVASVSGFAGKLTVGGAGVALASLSGMGDSTNPIDTISASAQQSKLTAS
jgi:hypothetical protein